VLAGLARFSRAPMQRAEAEVAAGDKRAHSAVIGHYQGCTVATCRRLDVEGVVM